MKKLLPLLSLIIAVMMGCDQTKTASSETSSAAGALLSDSVIYESLDGTPRESALKMIDYFKQNEDGFAKNSFVIKRDMMEVIYKMLEKERDTARAAGRKYLPDGLRIYFAKEKPESKELKLILVATTDSIPYTSGIKPDTVMHHDYYQHLYSDLHGAGIKLTVMPEGEKPAGALLREPIIDDDELRHSSCSGINQEGVVLKSYAKRMVQYFNGKVVNTKAVWFSLDKFKAMLNEGSFAGLRIYLATYPDNTYHAKDKSTFVLTTFDSTGKDYFHCDNKNKDTPRAFDPMNNGSLCPNNCNN